MKNDPMQHDDIKKIYETPLMHLLSRSHEIHLKNHRLGEIQVCSLISFKTGGCPEDCKYCPQSAHYKTGVKPLPLLSFDQIIKQAKEALKLGASRICIGAAWRQPKEGKAFETLLAAIKEISKWKIEVCCTLGMLTENQARQLKEAGLFAYNHNLDTSERFYKSIITTRTYEERLATLDNVEKAGLSVCCGAILGMGETSEDRISFIHTLASRKKPPDSIPINFLLPILGTPLEKAPKLSFEEALRTIATIRIVMPKTMIRLSAGRENRNLEEHLLYFFAGANSIFAGEKLLTQSNKSILEDETMFELFGLCCLAN